MLEQDGHVHVIAYASRSLNKAEQHYRVIQKECLAIVFALKQFHHYLLGRPFKLVTDHTALQWLSGQKMEGIICRWALAMQEYSFSIEYRKGSLNSNADALSRRVPLGDSLSAATQMTSADFMDDLCHTQQIDTTIRKLVDALKQPNERPSGKVWKSPTPLLLPPTVVIAGFGRWNCV